MKNGLVKVLNEYTLEKVNLFSGNQLANFIRHDLAKKIENSLSLGNKYLVTGSAGQGNWAEIPWICIFDKSITKSAQTGFYVVYLFKSDMSGLYLSLNQGWTQYQNKFGIKQGRIEIKKTTKQFQSLLRTTEGFSFKSIDLSTNNTLGQGYELGHICGKLYSKNDLENEELLIDDLRSLLSVYQEIKGLIGKDIFNLQFLDENEEELLPKEKIEINKMLSTKQTLEEINSALSKIEDKYKNNPPASKKRIAYAISRNSVIARLVKEKTNYTCEICSEVGFDKKDGGKYSEVHHKVELGDGGLDIPSNLLCVCANCHRKIHYGKENLLSTIKHD